jgi:hypothetical protein
VRGTLPLLLALGCTSQRGALGPAEQGVQRFGRPSGMPIGTAEPRTTQPPLNDADDLAPAELRSVGALATPQLQAVAALPAVGAIPCGGCVELQVDVSDINQRDEFAITCDGLAPERVVWTVLVNFNSDQLAVQPFVDDVYGKYTSLHVNTFPLGAAVEVVQELDGKARAKRAHQVGLKVGSSGAWTGNQRMSVFVAELRIEGPGAMHHAFEADAEGLEPRTRSRNPSVVFHPAQQVSLGAGAAPSQAAPAAN